MAVEFEQQTTALVPAHGPVLEDPQAVVDHYVTHRLAREAKVVAAIDAGATDVDTESEPIEIATEPTDSPRSSMASRLISDTTRNGPA